MPKIMQTWSLNMGFLRTGGQVFGTLGMVRHLAKNL